jgi:hypothetical protein
VIGPNGMAIRKNPHPARAAGMYRIAYPLRPGETRIQVSYRLPYAQKRAQVALSAPLPVANMEVYVPPPMKFSAPGFTLAGEADGYQVYQRRRPPPRVLAEVSGTAGIPAAMQSATTAPNAGNASGAAAGPAPAAPAGAAAESASGAPRPSFVERHQITLLLALALLAALGLGYMLQRPEASAAHAAVPPSARGGPAAAAPGDDTLEKLKN